MAIRVRRLLACALVAAACASAAAADTIEMTSPSLGSFLPGQTWNGETRAAEFTYTYTEPRDMIEMHFFGVVITEPSFVGLRLYAADGTLLASNGQFIPGVGEFVGGQPLVWTLQPGVTYYAAMFVAESESGNSGTVQDPNPPGVGGFPYDVGLATVVGAWSGLGDAFPTTPNSFVPQLEVVLPEPGVALLLALGGVLGARARRRTS